ncbi:MAG: hypothetical protein GY874_12940 [Desulfobacteraceae bacterium]|nr:hypothetical protein [Desulfobacteraceae bacterium]
MVRILIICMALILLTVQSAAAAGKEEKEFTEKELDRYFRQADREYVLNQKNLKFDEVHLLFEELQKRKSGSTAAAKSRAASGFASLGNPEKEQPGFGSSSGKARENQSSLASLTNHRRRDSLQTARSVQTQPELPANAKSSKKQGQTEHNDAILTSVTMVRKAKQTDRYLPPSFSITSSPTKAGGFAKSSSSKDSGPLFGIRRGTKFRVETRQIVTNVERNQMEIFVIQDVIGDYLIMPKETKLYASQSLNSGTNKLEGFVVSGITPEGREFKMQGIILNINKAAGLSGSITTDGNAAKRSLSAGGFEVGRSIVSSLNDGSVIGAGVEAAADSAFSEKKTHVQKQLNKPLYIISVEPQQFIIRVEKTF